MAVTTPYGSGSANAYTYVGPAVSSCSPDKGGMAGNTLVTITGSGFTGFTSVTFDGTAATSVTIVNDSTITCRTPAHAMGAVNIVVSNIYGSATGAGLFTYVPAGGFNMPMMGF